MMSGELKAVIEQRNIEILEVLPKMLRECPRYKQPREPKTF